MGTLNTILTILYLLLYFFMVTDTATEVKHITTTQMNQIEKASALSKEAFKGLDDVAKWVTESKDKTQKIQKILKVFDVFGKMSSSFGFLGALISLIFAFIPKHDPVFEFMKEQFAEVNRKLDSVSLQIETLQKEMQWANYASSYGKDENAIKNSWARLKELMDNAPIATTAEQKSRLAEQFTSFYLATGTESSVANLYRYITDHSGVSLNKNLLQLVTEKSNGDFKVLTQYSSYFTALMVSGLQMNVFYYKLKGYNAEAKAQESATQLSDTLLAIQDALIKCANDFEKWAKLDAQKLGTEPFSNIKHLAEDIKKHLEEKFIWYDWFVIAHSRDAEHEYTYGQSIDLIVQDKTIVHLVHREKKAIPNPTIVDQFKSNWLKQTITPDQCLVGFLQRLDAKSVSHIQWLHAVKKPSDYTQTANADVEFSCYYLMYGDGPLRNFIIFLKSQDVVKNPPCSNIKCHNGECIAIKDTTQGFCRCHKMYRGSTCEESIQNEIDYAATEVKINEIIIQPVPDLSAIYYGLKELREYTKELVESVQQNIDWMHVFVKYNEMIQKFRYVATIHNIFESNNISQSQYISEVGAQFTGGNTFMFYLTQFHNMMMGAGFGDKQNIIDVFRSSFILNTKSQSKDPVECTKTYSKQIDHFVRFMFTLEKEAVLAWQKYLIASEKSDQLHSMEKLFKSYVSKQWSFLNQRGCGPLMAKELDNNYCEKPYHSTDRQQVRLKCLGDYKPYPQTVQCSQGQWSAKPVCFMEQVNGHVQCKSEGGATVCSATCSQGWSLNKHSQTAVLKCEKQPCRAYITEKCLKCTDNSACKDHEICEPNSGTCRVGCEVAPCGELATCFYKAHQKKCTCGSPLEGNPYERCTSPALKWISGNHPGKIPNHIYTVS